MKNIILTEKEIKSCKEGIEDFIRKELRDSGRKGVVLGLSGGVDSSLTLRLAVNAIDDVYALILPEEGTTPEQDTKDAENLAKEFGVDYSIIPINDVLDSIKKTFLWGKFKSEKLKISEANLKPRIRMIFNYLVANLDNRIVLGTSNKTEILLGYLTKFGDGAADIEPIGGLYKTQVRQLASHLGLPDRIIRKTPTAGLWKGQTDEGELGARYEDIDKILFSLVDENLSVAETAKKLKLNSNLVKNINERMLKNRHKSKPPEIPILFD